MNKKKLVEQLSRIARILLRKNPTVAVIKLTGIIGAASQFKSGLTLESINDKIEEAFNISNLKAVALIINSPGGSPVQSELIYNRIRTLALEKNILVLSFVEDVAASGGYWLACAADKIYAAQNSVIGSIGVISSSFGFHKAINKLGIERRIYSEGNSKSILDPFTPEKDADIEILKNVQKDIYENFKNLVLTRRTNISSNNHDVIFSGAFWSSKKAKEFGLIDDFGDMNSVITEKFGKKITIIKINYDKSWLKSLLSTHLEISLGKFISFVEEKYISSKFGL